MALCEHVAHGEPNKPCTIALIKRKKIQKWTGKMRMDRPLQDLAIESRGFTCSVWLILCSFIALQSSSLRPRDTFAPGDAVITLILGVQDSFDYANDVIDTGLRNYG